MAPLATLILLVGSSLVHAEPTMRERAKSYRLRGIYPPVNAHHRGELVEICNLLGLTGNAAEIGVFHGGFSRHNLLHGQWKKYYMIDAWQFRPNQTVGGQLSPDKNEKSAIIHDRDYSIALNATQPWINRGVAVPMRTYSESAVSQFPDAFFDFIYVDAGHEYKHIMRDLKMWWPKLKPGGMYAGDDFVDAQDTFPYVKHHRGGREEAKTLLGGWGVKTAVVRFAEGVGSPFFLTFADRARDATERTPWLDEADPASEWFAGHTNRELRRITASDIVAPVRAHRIYPAWYMFKKAGKS